MKVLKFFCVAAALITLVSCEDLVFGPFVSDKDKITVSSPAPTEQITKVALNNTQLGYVQAGNAMAFRLLQKLYDGENLVCSPLSLQYALAMAANGASGETLKEIVDFLGYGADGIDALNAYCKILLEQLPAVDLDVSLKVTDALLVNSAFPLLPSFQKTVEENYYAAVKNMDFSSPDLIAAVINEWAKRNTNGFIDKVLDPEEISVESAAFLMNALYFKAQWTESWSGPRFREEATKEEKFTLASGAAKKLKMMNTMDYFQYAEMDGYTVVALPYANRKYFMYFLLPEKNDLKGMLNKLQKTAWKDISSKFKTDAEVYVKIPKFDIENKYNLKKTLQALGVKQAFMPGVAQFNRMFSDNSNYYYWIDRVIQKARISVNEWGTEAAAVTIVDMKAGSPGPGQEPKRIYFHADHPFAYIIGEASSGTILFEGVFAGK